MPTVNTLVPVARVSSSSDGAVNRTARAVNGLRTWVTPSLHTRLPKVQAPIAAVVRVSLTSKLPLAPDASVRLAGTTATVQPGKVVDAVKVLVALVTFVIVRRSVILPTASEAVIDARFRFHGEIDPTALQVPPPAESAPMPQRKRR